MHIILAFLGTVITILVLLNRLAEAGIDLGGLNPFLWRRRRQWQKRFEGNPIFLVEQPIEMAGLLATATVKSDGDMSSEEKNNLLDLFESEFNISKKEAAELLLSSSFLLGKGEEVKNNLEKVIKPSIENFTQEQVKSVISLLEKICENDAVGSGIKREFYERVKSIFDAEFSSQSNKW